MKVICIIMILNINCLDYLRVRNPPIFTANIATAYQQQYSKVVALTTGNFAIVYHSSTATTGVNGSNNYNIMFNIFDPNGKLLTNDILVNTPTIYPQIYPKICSDGNGGFVIIWEHSKFGPLDVFIRHYDATFTPGNIITVKSNISTNFISTFCQIAKLLNGNYLLFYGCQSGNYSVYAWIYDQNLNAVGAEFQIQGSNGMFNQSAHAYGLANGGFVLLRNNQIPTWDCFANFYDANAKQIGTEILINTNNSSGNQIWPTCTQIQNGNVVITWEDSIPNSGDVFARVFDQTGNSIGSIFAVNITTTGTQNSPFVFSLAFGGFGIVWVSNANSSTTNIILQIFDENNIKIGAEKLVNTDTSHAMTSPHVAEIKNGHVVILWTAAGQIQASDIFVQIYYDNEGICNDVQIQLVNQQTIQIDFFTNPYEDVILKSFPANGQLNDDKQISLALNNFIDKTKVFYTPNSLSADSFTFATNTNGAICNVVINVCYKTCATCTQIGDDNDHKCTQCVANYYKIKDSITNSCYLKTQIIQGYYFDSILSLFNKCYTRCISCSCGGDDNTHNCSICLANYYQLVDNSTQCYTLFEKVTGYFFDVLSSKFSKCYASCETCNSLGTSYTHQCLTCYSNYYPPEDDKTSCYNKDSTILGYYFDSSSNIFRKCFKSCSKCSGLGNLINPNCLECADGYSDCSGCTKKIFKDNCIDECPPLTIFNPTTQQCTDCIQGDVVFNNECISTCPLGYIKDSYSCYTCFDKNLFRYKNDCVTSCPTNTILNTTTNTCEIQCDLGYYDGVKGECVTCTSLSKIYFQGGCVDNCPDGYNNMINYCQLKLSGTANSMADNDYCIDNPCLNGGTCSISLNKFQCNCNSEYLGSTCQYEKQNFNFTDLVGKLKY
jgi:hypothetical protein